MYKYIKEHVVKTLVFGVVLITFVLGGLYYFNIITFSSPGGQEALASVSWFARNEQNLGTKVFGPSPKSEDTRELFQPGRDSFWTRMKKTYDAIQVHITLLDDGSRDTHINPVANASKIALSDTQIDELVRLQQEKGFRIVVPSGLHGMHPYCDETIPEVFAQKAVEHEMNIFKRVYSAGGRIDEFTIDGPFLTLLQGSIKLGGDIDDGDDSNNFTCHSQKDEDGKRKGKNAADAAAFVAAYMTELHEQAELAAGEAYDPDITLVLNLPNWRIGSYMEMHWGVTPKRNTWPLHSVLAEFSSLSYPNLKTVLIDFPYDLIDPVKGGITTKQQGQYSYNNCAFIKPGSDERINCRTISPSESFSGKIVELNTLLSNLRGAPKLSFYVNTSDNYQRGKGNPLCATAEGPTWVSNRVPPYLIYENNRCFGGAWPFIDDGSGVSTARDVWSASDIDTPSEADADQLSRDTNYTLETRRYYNLVKHGLPSGVDVHGVYVVSWHDNPRSAASWGLQVANAIDANP